MIRPHRFHPNPETAADNAFQRNIDKSGGEASATAVSHAARDEVTAAAVALEEAGVRVHVFDDFGERASQWRSRPRIRTAPRSTTRT